MDKGTKDKHQQQPLSGLSVTSKRDEIKVTAKPKEKRRSNEKRKEKSRDAARCRRSRETEIFNELASVIPVRHEDVEQLDKASIMRLAIAFLKVRDVLKLFPNSKNVTEEDNDDDTDENKNDTKPFDILWNSNDTNKILSESLDGFLIMLSTEGDVTYVSESIADILGIAQIDVLGQQVWDYLHQCDHDELKETLNMRKKKDDIRDENENKNGIITIHCDSFLRFKCTLTSRGRSVNIKSASYKVIHLTGHMVINSDGDKILIAVGRPLPHPSNIEIPLGTTTFLTKHSLDMKFTYVDDKILSLLKYNQDDLLGKSLYNYHHAADSESLMATFKSALSKGQSETCRYRFLGKFGGYCWLVTQATIVYDKQKPQSVVCVNFMISNLENENEICSCEQYEAANEINKNIKDSTLSSTSLSSSSVSSSTTAIQNLKNKNIIIIKNNNDNKIIDNNKINYNKNCELKIKIDRSDNLNTKIKIASNSRENSLSPIRRTFNNCTISSELLKQQQQQQDCKSAPELLISNQKQNKNHIIKPTPTLPNSITDIDSTKVSGNNSKLPINEKRPKSVTASVFTQVRGSCGNSNNNSIGIIGGNQSLFLTPSTSVQNSIEININNLPQIQIAPTAQSVTASLFKPISQQPFLTQRNFNNINNINNNSGFVINNQQIKTQNFSPIPHLQPYIQNNIKSVPEEPERSPSERSEDMNKGFLSFTEDTPELTMLKEEPDDLTHLAPSTGDSCIQLDEPTPLFGEMLESLILPDAYCSLLPDDINSLDSQHSCTTTATNQNNTSNKGSIDPFINYRDESSDTNSSPHLLSPCGLSKSPEASSLPSLCSPHSMNQDDEFAFMTMNVDDDIDLTMRAPYIPMNEQDDLPLLTDDLMWSAFSEELSLHKEIKDVMQMHDVLVKNHINNNNNNNSSNNWHNSSTLIDTISNNNNYNNTTNNRQNSKHNNINNNSNQNANDLLNNNDTNLTQILCGVNNNDNCTNDNNNNYKKRKFDDDQFNDSIHSAFGQVFNNKNSSNLDCWTMNDLLQMNTTTNQQDNKQNLIINTNGQQQGTTTATIHVPLITIQNNQKINNALNTKLNLTIINNSSNNNNNNNNNKIIEDENNCLSANLTNHSNKNMKLSNNNSNLSQKNHENLKNTSMIGKHDVSIGSCNGNGNINIVCGRTDINTCNNKRHLTENTLLDSKRVKNNNSQTTSSLSSSPSSRTSSPASSLSSSPVATHSNATLLSIDKKTSPNLLQQLMAATPQQLHQQKTTQKYLSNSPSSLSSSLSSSSSSSASSSLSSSPSTSYDKLNKWQNGGEGINKNNGNGISHHHQQQQQSPSNSVLKNLLVSGCDTPLTPLTTNECNCHDDFVPTGPNSPYFNNNSIPLHIRTEQFLRHCCGTNPMIGGNGLLPSPTIPQLLITSASGENATHQITTNNGQNEVPDHMLCSLNGSVDDRTCCEGFFSTVSTPAASPNSNHKYMINSPLVGVETFRITPSIELQSPVLFQSDETSNTSSLMMMTPTKICNSNDNSRTSSNTSNTASMKNINQKSSFSFMESENPFGSQFLMDLCNDDYNMDANINDFLAVEGNGLPNVFEQF